MALLLAVQTLAVERSTRARQALDLTPLDVAFLDADRVFVLSEDMVSLYRIEAGGLVLVSRLALPGAPARARAAAGMLRVVPQDGACWALSNRRGGATLFNVEGDRLAAVAGAEAIPPTRRAAVAVVAKSTFFIAFLVFLSLKPISNPGDPDQVGTFISHPPGGGQANGGRANLLLETMMHLCHSGLRGALRGASRFALAARRASLYTPPRMPEDPAGR